MIFLKFLKSINAGHFCGTSEKDNYKVTFVDFGIVCTYITYCIYEYFKRNYFQHQVKGKCRIQMFCYEKLKSLGTSEKDNYKVTLNFGIVCTYHNLLEYFKRNYSTSGSVKGKCRIQMFCYEKLKT